MKKKILLSKISTIIVTEVINCLSTRERKILNEYEVFYIEGLIDMSLICEKISEDEKEFLYDFLKIFS